MPTVALVNASARMDGISNAARNIQRAFRELAYGVVWYQCVDRGQDSQISEMDRIIPGLGFPNDTVDMGINRLWVFAHRLRRIPEETVLLMDPTLVNVARYHPRTAVRVFDLKPLSAHADRRAATWMFRYALPRLRAVRRVLVPSAYLAQELATRGISPEQIRVLPETHSLGFHHDHVGTSVDRIRATGAVRVLYVATDRPPKNLRFFIRLAQLAAQFSGPPRLEFTLLSRLRPETRALVSERNLPNLTIIPEVRSAADVYAANDVLVFPSLHEGFGLPVIEAMAFGLPVIASNLPSLQEVVTDSGTLLDPGAPEPWMESLRALAEPSFYEAAARRSLARGENFSPARFRETVGRIFQDM